MTVLYDSTHEISQKLKVESDCQGLGQDGEEEGAAQALERSPQGPPSWEMPRLCSPPQRPRLFL